MASTPVPFSETDGTRNLEDTDGSKCDVVEHRSPRISMFRMAPEPWFQGDPRARYTRALVNLVRVGDVAGVLALSEIFEALCEAIAEPVRLVVAVLIDVAAGLPRAMHWKADGVAWTAVAHGETLAWSTFAELFSPDLLSSLPLPTDPPSSTARLHWTAQTLSRLGIVQYGTEGRLAETDVGLLRCMSLRLAAVLTRAAGDDAIGSAAAVARP
jgi:hypothetical protein